MKKGDSAFDKPTWDIEEIKLLCEPTPKGTEVQIRYTPEQIQELEQDLKSIADAQLVSMVSLQNVVVG